jgi:peptide/nickel transport system permease protein
VAGYSGGLVDRALMSINDTFIVIPLFPILVLFYFVLRDHMSWACWPDDGVSRLGL